MRYLIILLILLWTVPAFATVQFFPADSPTVGLNSVDTILGDGSAGVYEALDDGDMALVSTTGLDVCLYVLDTDSACGATTTETPCPQYIQPETVGTCTDCCWVLTDFNGIGFTALPSATPAVNYLDSDATAGDTNCRSYVTCTDTGDGTEDCDWTLACQVAGAETDKIVVDADGYTTITALAATSASLITPDIGAATGTSAVLTGDIRGMITTAIDADGIADMTAAQCRGQVYINTTQTNTYALPAAAAGQNCCFYANSAHKVTVDVDDGVDQIMYQGITIGAGDELDSPASAGAYACFLGIDETYWLVLGSSGAWVDD